MSLESLKDVKAGFSRFVDKAAAGEFVTITRHGRPAAVLVSLAAAEAAKASLAGKGRRLSEYLTTFPHEPDLDEVLKRNPAASRTVEF